MYRCVNFQRSKIIHVEKSEHYMYDEGRLTQAWQTVQITTVIQCTSRQCDRVFLTPDLKSGGHRFKSSSDHKAEVVSQ